MLGLSVAEVLGVPVIDLVCDADCDCDVEPEGVAVSLGLCEGVRLRVADSDGLLDALGVTEAERVGLYEAREVLSSAHQACGYYAYPPTPVMASRTARAKESPF